MPIKNSLTRRSLLLGAALLALPFRALALTGPQATTYVQDIINDVMGVINSDLTVDEIMGRFENVFVSYADIPTIARLVLGAQWRTTSGSQRNAFALAFGHYLSVRYGRQFREYRGATITIKRVADGGRKGFLVYSQVRQPGQSPFNLDWQVSDGSGRTKMIDMIIEGISLISSEREEIRALLAARGGNVAALTAFLRDY